VSRRPGRPPLDPTDPSVRLSVRLPAKAYDALYTRARDARLSFADYLRQQLRPGGTTPREGNARRRP